MSSICQRCQRLIILSVGKGVIKTALLYRIGVCVYVFVCWGRVGYKLGATFGRLAGVLIIITMQIVFDSAILLLEI